MAIKERIVEATRDGEVVLLGRIDDLCSDIPPHQNVVEIAEI